MCGSGGTLRPTARPQHGGPDHAEPVRSRDRGFERQRTAEMGGLKLDRITAKAMFTRLSIRMARRGPRAQGRHPGRARRTLAGRPSSLAACATSTTTGAVPGDLRDAVESPADAFVTAALFASDAITRQAGHGQCRPPVRPQPRPSARTCQALDASAARDRPRRSTAWARSTPGTSCLRALGVTAKLTADGRTDAPRELRTLQSGRADRRAQPRPSRRDADERWRSTRPPATTRTRLGRRPEINLALDPHTRTPRTDEYSVASSASSRGDCRRPSRTSGRAAPTSSPGPTRRGNYRRRRARSRRLLRCPCSCSRTRRRRRFLLTNPAGFLLNTTGWWSR